MEGELKFICEDMIKLCSIITKVTDHVSAHTYSFENTMLSIVIADEVAQQRSDVSLILEGRDALSHEMYFRLSRVAERLASLELK